jgi:hypothetical protein
MHPKIENPVVREIRRNLGEKYNELLNSEAISTTTQNLLLISWIVQFLSFYDEDIGNDFVTRCQAMVNEMLMGESPPSLKQLNAKNLEGLFISARLIIESGGHDMSKLKNGFERLLILLDDHQWLSSPSLAAYAAHGLRDIASDEIIHKAEQFIRKYYGPISADIAFDHPEILLAFPSMLSQEEVKLRLRSDDFWSDNINSRALLLYILTTHARPSDNPDLKESAILLLEKCGKDLTLRPDEYSPLAQSLLGLGFIIFDFSQVYLINTIDYSRAKIFFQTDSIAISKRIEYIQEIIVLGVVLVLMYFGTVAIGPILVSLFIMARPLEAELAGAILIAIYGFVLFGFIAPVFLPGLHELGRKILPSRRGREETE